MAFEEGIRLLQELGCRPDVLYWEGFPHEDGVLSTLTLAQQVRRGYTWCVYLPAKKEYMCVSAHSLAHVRLCWLLYAERARMHV